MPNAMRQQAIEGLKAGDTFQYSRTFTQEESEAFGDLTRDYNPVHYDPRWAREKGFKGLICHGLIVGSMICELGGQVGMLATRMDFRYLKPVYFDATITCTLEMTSIADSGQAEAEAFFTNEDDEQVCTAFLTGRVPLKQERELLKKIVEEGDPANKLSEEQHPVDG